MKLRIINLALLLVFIILTYFIVSQKLLILDRSIATSAYALRSQAVTLLISAISHLSNTSIGVMLTIFIALLALFKKQQKTAAILVFTILVSSVLNYGVKNLLQIPRPNISPLENFNGFSYPSGHAMNNLVLYGMLALLAARTTENKNHKMIYFFAAILWIGTIGFSRVYLGAHYPSDVLAGYLLGGWWLMTAMKISKYS